MSNNAIRNKTCWIGWIAVFVVMQVYGYIIHTLGMADAYESLASIFRPEAEMMDMMWMMMVGSLGSTAVFCYIFTFGAEGKGVMEGWRYGFWMGLFLSIPYSVDQYVIYPLTGEVAVIWFATGVLGLMIAGAVFAAIYKPSAA
jgi:hypothetical protein